ncbi:adhesion G protein-coupled receptor E2-like isoform X1 [Hemiscyllium ocellatum]|uniref:adhesion G protein-coupled receptor E2-like isoform X1 n=1 Tax=Hemiscyllium ocellatum TaxID=170820 RepID=UPI0029665DA9|nr:adhesion G protein-coupled receptor E2-like isoform X1 [Hemiscyllium ocellatum]
MNFPGEGKGNRKMKTCRCLTLLMIFLCRVSSEKCSTGTTCADMDKCQTNPCGSNAICHSTSGSFYCTCEKGYYSTGDKHFVSAAVASCIDYDECRSIQALCGRNATCYNTAGGFYCLCNKGFARVSGQTNFTGYGAGCKDIDECLQDPCYADAVCQNIKGSYICIPQSGFDSSYVNKVPQSPFLRCLAVLLKDQSIIDKCYSQRQAGSLQPTTDQLCSLIKPTLTFAEGMCQVKEIARSAHSHVTLKNVMSFGNKFFNDSSKLEKVDDENQLQSTSLFLNAMESFTLGAALASPGQKTKNVTTSHLGFDVRIIQVQEHSKIPDKITLHAKGNTMDAYSRTVTEGETSGSIAIAFISYDRLNFLQSGHFIENERTRPYQLISGVVSATIGNHRRHKLRERVNITLKHKKRTDGCLVCVYWNHTEDRSHWSPEGCVMIASNKTHTVCGCHHLSSFAVLMTAVEEDGHLDWNLSIITLVGISLSLICLGFAIITFRFCTQVTSHNHIIHINLCITLFLAELLFLVGIHKTSNKVACAVITGCLHYLFLAAFAWMCVEGIHLHLMVRNLQKINNSCARKGLSWFMYPFGYGVPAVIVTVSAAMYPTGYGTQRYCWLTTENGLIWSFIGPVCLIILFNMTLFAVTLWILKVQLTRLNAEVTKIKDMRTLIFKATAQVFVLGCTWLLGLFHFQASKLVTAYLFTIVNSLQGVFIFIILCLLNRQVRDGYWAWFNKLCMIRKKPGFTDSGSNSVPLTTLLSQQERI